MSCNYSANQFNSAFSAQRLRNWEVPKWYPSQRPKSRNGPVKPIADIDGRLYENAPKSKTSPWGDFKNTWQLPDKINRHQANEINKSNLIESQRWASRVKRFPFENQTQTCCEVEKNINTEEKPPNNTSLDLEYIPGDFTKTQQRHESRDLLEKQKRDRDRGKSPQYELNDLYLEKHKCTDRVALLNEKEKKRREKIPHVLGDDVEPISISPQYKSPSDNEDNLEEMKKSKPIPDKPNERYSAPIIPAFFNFQLAKQMHQENLEHQPLPDCVTDRAFRKLQAEGHLPPGLALDVIPTATGVAVKTYQAGPTHCTKMKIYRPKTCGVVPKPIKSAEIHRPQTSAIRKPIGSMDLAICWDFRPVDPEIEPKPPKHIDGSNGSAAPAVFTMVKTPRTPEKIDTGRSAGIFTSTLGEPNFFDKDILRRKTGFMQRSKSDLKCSCGTSPINAAKDQEIRYVRSRSAFKDESVQTENRKRCKSSPNLSVIAINNYIYQEDEKQNKEINNNQYEDDKQQMEKGHVLKKYGSKNKKVQANVRKRTFRLCQKVAPIPYPEEREKEEYKTAFKAGKPKRNSDGTVNSTDSCSTLTTSSTKVILIPKPRNPYMKKNYNIDTLVPPFTCYKGGAGQGGYPEHWRLASVYQHAYKPIEQRKRTLLQTVYK